MTKPVLEIRSATLRFGQTTLWSDLNLQVQPQEFIAVIGANGSGKTSLLQAILGQTPLTQGQILLCGDPIGAGSSRTVTFRSIAAPMPALRFAPEICSDWAWTGIVSACRCRVRKLALACSTFWIAFRVTTLPTSR